jgi:hypothetical protein
VGEREEDVSDGVRAKGISSGSTSVMSHGTGRSHAGFDRGWRVIPPACRGSLPSGRTGVTRGKFPRG